jgi:hypothetical protein
MKRLQTKQGGGRLAESSLEQLGYPLNNEVEEILNDFGFELEVDKNAMKKGLAPFLQSDTWGVDIQTNFLLYSLERDSNINFNTFEDLVKHLKRTGPEKDFGL